MSSISVFKLTRDCLLTCILIILKLAPCHFHFLEFCIVHFIATTCIHFQESFLEDINSVLNSGEISDLYDKEEIDGIALNLKREAAAADIPDDKQALYQFFIQVHIFFHFTENLEITTCKRKHVIQCHRLVAKLNFSIAEK